MNDELLIKFLLKETSETENIAVKEWLAADEANLTSFNQFGKIWEASKNLEQLSQVDEMVAWERFKVKASALPKETAGLSNEKTSQLNETEGLAITTSVSPLKETRVIPLKENSRNYSWLKIAAIFVMAIGIWALYPLFKQTAYTELSAQNEVKTTTLPDGSSITLNKKSLLSYATDFKNHRSIRLDSGEVFFNVAHDKTKPFIIKTNQVAIEVVGTSFNVKHLNQETEVIVETGIVKVSIGAEEIKLTKGEKVLIGHNSKQLIKVQNQDQLYNYYRTRLLELNNTPLWKVAAVLSEAYGQKITLEPAIRSLTLTTTLKLEATLDQNLKLICLSLDLTRSNQQQEILLSKSEL